MRNTKPSPLLRFWDHAEEWVILGLLAYMALSLNVEVVRRYLFSASSPYTSEIARFSLIWIVFLGIPYAIRHEGHIVIDFVSGILGRRTDLKLRIFTDIIFALFCLVFAWISLGVLLEFKKLGIVTDALEMPKWQAFLCMPIGAIFGFLRLLQNISGNIRSLSAPETNQPPPAC